MWYQLRHAEVKVLLEAVAQLQAGEWDATDRQAEALEAVRQKLLARRKSTGFPELLNACDELAANDLEPDFVRRLDSDTQEFIEAGHKVMLAAKVIQEGLDG